MLQENEEVVEVPKFREVVRESIVKAPPGHHGVIVEIDLSRVNEENIQTQDCLQIYSLKAIQETIQEPITVSEVSEHPLD